MRRIVIVLGVILGACGGTKIPVHSGYKSDKAKPWTKAKAIPFDEKMEAKAEGDLNYGEMRRARWYSIDVPSNGELGLKLEVTPPGDATNEDFDLAMEILDPGNRVISKADMEEEDVGELNKLRTLYDLAPGKYLVHIYLQGRLDSADYVLRATFKRTAAAEVKSDFPAQVQFLGALPMVPLNDDTPAGYKSKQVAVVTIKKKNRDKKEVPVAAPVATGKKGRIVQMSVAGGGTVITVSVGTDQGAATGWKAQIAGVSGSYSVGNCNPRTCSVQVSGATPDQIKAGGGTVTLSP
jgi:hypothetical protein